MLSRLLPLSLSLLVLLAASRGGVRVEHPEPHLRGAARAARSGHARPHAAGDPGVRGRPRARARLLADFAPAATSKRRPDFDAADPAAYPAGTWTGSTRCSRRPARAASPSSSRSPGRCRRWATASKRDTVTKPSPKEFQAFATAVGRRFGDRVGLWSIWNEPNHPQFLRPQFVRKKRAKSPRIYRNLFLAGQRGLRASGNGADTLLFGETAPRGTPRVVAPLAFLRGALCLNRSYKRRGKCGRVERRRLRPPRLHDARRPALHAARSRRRDDRRALAPHHARSTAPARAGAIARGLGIYLTEFGIQSTPDPFVGVSLARQAEYLGIAEHMAYVNPRVRSFSQYLLHDDRPRKGSRVERYGGFESGLRRSNGRAKPSYAAFRLPLAAESLRALGRPVGPRAPVADADRGHDPRLAAQGQAVPRAAHGHDERPRRLRPARAGTTTSSATACSGPRRTARSGSARRSAPPSRTFPRPAA